MLELPSFFQPSPEDRVPPSPSSNAASMVQYYEKTTLNLSLHSRMMRLHRPWLSRGYSDERFSYSKEQCIRAARAGLRLMCGGENKNVAQFLEKWWYVLVTFTSLHTPEFYNEDQFNRFNCSLAKHLATPCRCRRTADMLGYRSSTFRYRPWSSLSISWYVPSVPGLIGLLHIANESVAYKQEGHAFERDGAEIRGSQRQS